MKTLLIGPIHEEAHQLLKQHTELTEVSVEDFPNNQFPEIEAVVLRTYTELKDLSNLPNLKYVVSCSVGVNNLDLDLLKQKNIELIHCPGTNSNSVAEHTLHLILSLLRRKIPFPELKGKTVGIVGFGHIGKIVAKKLKGFECNIIAFDVIEQDPEVLKELNTTIKSMEEVAKESDIITIHVPLNKYTHHLINEEFFGNMKPNSFFINTSREEIIDEDALIKHKDKFRDIGLDVFSENQKTHLAGALLTYHVAAQGEESFKRMCLEPVEKFLQLSKHT